MAHKLQARRSLGIGITGLAGWLGEHSLRYADTASIEALAERHYYWCLKASQRLVLEGRAPVSGIREDWLPIDTGHQTVPPTMDWESLRGKPRRNSVLVAHMPTESSAVFSDAPNGLYPVRDSVIAKASRYGLIKYIAPAVCTERAWDVGNDVLARAYGAVQSYTDQAISADYYVTPSRYPGGNAPPLKSLVSRPCTTPTPTISMAVRSPNRMVRAATAPANGKEESCQFLMPEIPDTKPVTNACSWV